jgi:hypothetical protein
MRGYCGEPFENDGSMVSTILKNMKRAMAGEYSRELSLKVSRAQRQQALLGFRQGGVMQYGVRRLLVDKNRKPRFQLGPGERKGLSTDRVLLVPGPPDEISVVRRIFRMFVDQKRSMISISRTLNREGTPAASGRAWNHRQVRTVLTSELMVGYYVYNRRSYPINGRPRPNPPDQWIRTRVMDPIVDVKKFERAQRELGVTRGYGYARTRMITSLRRLLKEKKKLTLAIINACPYTPCSGTYVRHFGSVQAAYAAVGYKQTRADRKPYSHYTDEELIDGIRPYMTLSDLSWPRT